MTEVDEIMTKDVKVIKKDKSIFKAIEKMNQYDVGCLVVVEDSRAAGIITSSDILYGAVLEGMKLKKTEIDQIMSENLIVISPNATLQEAAETMSKNKVKKLPVVSEKDGELLGIITATDLVAHRPEFSNILVNLDLPQQTTYIGS